MGGPERLHRLEHRGGQWRGAVVVKVDQGHSESIQGAEAWRGWQTPERQGSQLGVAKQPFPPGGRIMATLTMKLREGQVPDCEGRDPD